MFEQPFHSYMQRSERQLKDEVERLLEDEIRSNQVDELASRLALPHRHDVPVIETDPQQFRWEAVKNEASDDQSVNVHVPFSGNRELFAYHPSSYPVLNVPVSIGQSSLTISTRLSRSKPEPQIETVKSEVLRIADCMKSLAEMARHHNERMRTLAKELIEARRARFAAQDSFLEKLSALVPIKRRDDEVKQVMLPVERKQMPVIAQKTAGTISTEPAITFEAYEDILVVITAMVRVFERSPATFKLMDEEDLRTILLVALNGIYQGRATGETFNGGGKNDILIREGDKNVFIAECLIWEGPRYLQEKIDEQLLKLYATWRDSKLAVLIFNRNKNFSSVIAKMKEVCEAHPQRVRTLPYDHESGARYIFRRKDDPEREMYLTVLAFEVPA